MKANGYNKTTSDYCVFLKKVYNDNFFIPLLYVDYILIVGHDMVNIRKL